MSGKLFDKTSDPMSDLTLKMTEELKPEIIEDVPNMEEEKATPREVENIFVVRKQAQGIKKDVMEDPLPDMGIESIVNDEDIPRIQGERGKDKKPRKKRVMTPEALEKLAKAREKSLANRRAKSAAKKAATEDARVKRAKKKRQIRAATPLPLSPVSENIKIPFKTIKQQEAKLPTKPVNVFNDFDNFCDFMERYDERKKKKHSTSNQPHPNKRMPDQHRPRPPITPVERVPVHRGGSRRTSSPPAGNFSPYSLLKRGNSQFGKGTNNYGGNW
tara:strand:+ start:764 stop:1582 length:819 start_codon:yes stop_codon:yes gene_type:complete